MHVTLVQAQETQAQVNVAQLKSLQDAGLDAASLLMRELDQEHLAHLVESNPDEWVSITLVRTSIGDVIIDGYHRVAASIALKRPTIAAIYKNYPDEKAVIDAAFQANLKHGLPANDRSRTIYAAWLMGAFNYSQRQAAKRAGVSHAAVSKWLKKLAQEKEDAEYESQSGYSPSYAKKLAKALQGFYENETALFRSKGSDRSEEKRAKSLVDAVEKNAAMVQILQSMARSFNIAAKLIDDQLPKQKKA